MYFILVISILVIFTSGADASDNCRLNIERKICWVAPRPFSEMGKPAPCISDKLERPVATKQLNAVYDNLPTAMQKLFCTLKGIYVETAPDLIYQAYADQIADSSNKVTGSVLGFNHQVFFDKTSLSAALGRTQATPFGRPPQIESIGYFEAPEIAGLNGALFRATAHELGHVLDLFNDVNPMGKGCEKIPFPDALSERCLAKPGSWTALSWINMKKSAFDDTSFPDRRDFEAYFRPNGPYVSYSRADQLFSELDQSSFLTTVASTQPFDDWAESLAIYLVVKKINGPLKLHLHSGKTFNMTAKIKSPTFKAKRNYIESFLKRRDLNYPGYSEE